MKADHTMLFVATNGVGLGHLTRALGIAKQVQKLFPASKIVFLITSLATDVVTQQGFEYYYIPSKNILPSNVTADVWNRMLLEKMQEIQKKHEAEAVVFDGAYPYQGLTNFFKQYPEVKTFWIKREGDREKEVTLRLRDKANYFHHIIVPKEIKGEYDTYDGKFYCEPIIMMEQEALLSREEARKSLNIPSDKKVFYIQLGAGIINNINQDLKTIVEYLLEDEENFLLVGESIIGKKIDIAYPNVKILRHYPNAIYYRGCDFAISAAGYNSFHELIYFNIPTLFIPNKETVKDDQVARAYKAEELGVGTCILEVNRSNLQQAIYKLKQNREEMILNAQKYLSYNGAEEAAHYIINHL
ncbi:MAG: hypothetical protein H9893_01680 [Candidatus Niameybacter stercoravium]|nr:hypothetical protein [Candidatus Niameybacter stercoravium]